MKHLKIPAIIILLSILTFIFYKFIPPIEAVKIDNSSDKKHRIASFSSSITETIYYLELDDMLIANTDFCNYPADAKVKKKLGSLGNINYELLVALGIDIAILPKYMQESVSILNGYGIETILVDHRNIDGIIRAIDDIRAFFKTETYDNIGNDMIKIRLDDIDKNKCDIENNRVMFVVFHDLGNNDIGSITVAANDGYYSDMIMRAGGENIFGGINSPYPVFDKEAILISNPDIIIQLLKPEDNKVKILSEWQKLNGINAVRNNQIYLLEDISHSIPGPRFINTLETILSIICSKGLKDVTH